MSETASETLTRVLGVLPFELGIYQRSHFRPIPGTSNALILGERKLLIRDEQVYLEDPVLTGVFRNKGPITSLHHLGQRLSDNV